MGMKWAVGFVAGLLVGAGAMIALQPDRTAHLKTELASARAEVERAGKALEEARTKIAAAQKAARPAPGGPRPGPAIAKSKAKLSSGEAFGRKIGEMIKTMGAAQMKAQLEAKVAQLVARLNLTPEQEARLRALIEPQAEAMSKAMEGFFEGKADAGKLADAGKMAEAGMIQAGKLPKEIEATLSPEQKAEYAKFQEEERTNRIEMRANAEFIGLQSMAGLTQDQKDRAYSKLCDLVAQDEEQMTKDPGKAAQNVGDYFQRHTAKRIEAMREILTEPQLKSYEAQMEMQRQFMSQMGAEVKVNAQSAPAK